MDRRKALIDQALEQLENPSFPDLKAKRQIRGVLVEGQKSGKLEPEKLGRATIELVREADVMRFAGKRDGRNEDAVSGGIGILFLLIFLLLLLALAGDDSDLGALIQELIDQLLGRN